MHVLTVYIYIESTELKKYLEDKLKQAGEQGGIADQGEFNENESSGSQIF